MAVTPSVRAYEKWANSNGADDYLQLILPNGSIIGWIDSGGILQGALSPDLTTGVFPMIVNSLTLKNQTAAISGASLYKTPPGEFGFYRINYVATVTSSAGGSSVLGGANGFQITYINVNGDSANKTSNPTTPTVSSGNTTSTSISGSVMCYAGGPITYSFGYTSVGGQMIYDLAVNMEYLGA